MLIHVIEFAAAGAGALLYVERRLTNRNRASLDHQRRFTEAQRAEIFARSGGRCEHKSPMWFRCRRRATHADHLMPWSRGGTTTLENSQALCSFHNLSKGAKVPGRMEVARLYRRRRNY